MQNGEGTEETAGTKNQTSSHHNIGRETFRQQKDGGWWILVLVMVVVLVGGWVVVVVVVVAVSRLVFDVSSGQ